MHRGESTELAWAVTSPAEGAQVRAVGIVEAQLHAPAVTDRDAPVGQSDGAGDVAELVGRARSRTDNHRWRGAQPKSFGCCPDWLRVLDDPRPDTLREDRCCDEAEGAEERGQR